MMKKSPFLAFALLSFLLGTACRFQNADKIHWDATILAPILQSKVTLSDAIRDTSILQTDNDQFVRLVFRDTLLNMALIDQVTVPDTSVEATVTLDSISLSTDSLVQDITLADMARQLSAQGNPLGDSLLVWDGRFISYLPPFSGLSSGDVPIDASQFFQEATLLTGQLEVTISNHLPVSIQQATYHLRNAGMYNDTLIRRTITAIAPGASVTDIADLSGKTIESELAGQLESISTNFGGGFVLDTSDYIRLKIKVANLKASQATAVFPSQTVIHDNYPVRYFFGDGIKLTRMKVGSGSIEVSTVSSIQDTLQFIYSLPSARKNGLPVVVESKLLPAPPNGQIQNQQSFDLGGYSIDLTLNGDSVNIFPQVLTGNLIYSGNVVEMDLADLIYVSYGLKGIVPNYVEGDLGKHEFYFQDAIQLDFFDRLLGGTVNMKNIQATLILRNSVGMDGQLELQQFTARNSGTQQTVNLTGSVTQQPIWVPGPKLPNIGQFTETSIQLDRSNSNVRDFLSILPDELEYQMKVTTNPLTSPEDISNFATDKSSIQAFLDLEIPLEGMANGLHLRDTAALNLGTDAIPSGIEEGTLKLWVENTFPLQARVQVYFLSENGVVVDSLFQPSPGIITAGTVGPNGRVEAPSPTQLECQFDAQRMEILSKRAKYAVAEFHLDTQPAQQDVRIYADYGIQFKLVGDFAYWVGK